MENRPMFRIAQLVTCAGGVALAAMAIGQPPTIIPAPSGAPGKAPAQAPLPGDDTDALANPTPIQRDSKPVDVSKGVRLIPRAILFGNPDKAQGRVSPDGESISFLAPVNGVLNVWVGPRGDLSKAKPVTHDEKRGIRQYSWAYTSTHVIYMQDKGGDENWRVYAVDLTTGAERDLTPFKDTAARIQEVSEKFPDEILVALNDRNPTYHDLYRINVRTGERTLVLKNDSFAGFVTDDDYRVRFGQKPNPDGSVAILKASEGGKGEFELYDTIPMEDADTTNIVDFDKTGKLAYMLDGRGRDKSALCELNVETKAKRVIYEPPNCDIDGLMVNPKTKELEAFRTNYQHESWTFMNPAVQPDFYAIATQGGAGDFNVTSRSKDDRYWIVTIVSDEAPARTCLLDRGDFKEPKRAPKLTQLFVSRQDLVGQPLVPMHPVDIKARDGMNLVSYLSLPLDADANKDGKPEKVSPLVLLVHGGPWARDTWGYNPTAQWFANRGYAVLQVNFRGSTGFGKKHLNSSNLEWAGKMHDDLIDAVKWAVDQKIADPKKVCITGGSYGGYATLVGLTFTPDVFACGVDIVGPSNLNTLLKSIPAYWQPEIDLMCKRVGDYRTEEGKKLLDSRSPLSSVDKISKPLLIGQGANDPRVKQAEADQIVEAMTAKKIPVTYVLYPDEGHGFARPPNRISFNAVTEAFLAKHLGGRCEPIGDALKGSTIQVPTGADGVPGLTEALAAQSAAAEPKK
jgi:dipeptidyl aminopeptidase/acylaminoacyl peptidase